MPGLLARLTRLHETVIPRYSPAASATAFQEGQRVFASLALSASLGGAAGPAAQPASSPAGHIDYTDPALAVTCP